MAGNWIVTPGGRQVEIVQVAPAAQLSTASLAVIADSLIDARAWKALSYTIKVATQNVDWQIQGANLLDFSDAVVVQAQTTVNAGAVGSYSTTQVVWNYYRVRIVDTAGGVHGTATVSGTAKA